MKKIKMIFCTFLVMCTAVLPIFGTQSAFADDDINSLVQKLQQLDEESKEYQEVLDKTKSDIKQKEKYAENLVNKIGVLDEKIAVTNKSIEKLNSKIQEKQNELNKINSNLDEQISVLCERIRIIYMAGNASDIEILLGAKDFSDFIDKVQLVKTLSAYDKQLINEINEDIDKLNKQMDELENSKSEVEEQKSNLQDDEDELNKLVQDNKKTLDDLYKTSEKTEKEIQKAELNSKEVEKQIQDYYKELAQKSSFAGNAEVSATGYTWPAPGCSVLTSQWNESREGYNHGAIDIGCSTGSTVVAAYQGTVISVNNNCRHNWGKSESCGCGGGYGNYVMIDHGNGKMSIYAHLTYAAVEAGETVKTGQTIGFAGSTGESTGAHLHFECRIYGVKYNPMIEFEN